MQDYHSHTAATQHWLRDDKVQSLSDADNSGSTSLAVIVATFIPTFLTAVVFLSIFLAIRTSYLKIYAPRTFMGTLKKQDQTPSSRSKGSRWIHDFRKLDDKFVLQHQSLDGYLFLRFLKFIICICLAGVCITWPILFPVNATGGGSAKQLDRIGFGNIHDKTRLYAHAAVAWVFLGGVLLLIAHERLVLIGMRQAYLFSKQNTSKLSSRVVLFTAVPKDALKEEQLRHYFGEEAQKPWPVAKIDKLAALVGERSAKASMLESAEVELAKLANKRRLQNTQRNSNHNDVHELDSGEQPDLVDVNSRPKHRLTPLIGTKVDTLDWTRKTIPDLSSQIQEFRDTLKGQGTSDTSAVFVAFKTQAAAHRAYQNIHFGLPLPTQTRYIGVEPKEVLWENLVVQPSVRASRSVIATAFVVASVIFWSIPIGFVGAISNVEFLADKVLFLRFIRNLPPAVLGLLEGLVPPYVISTFVSYVPKIYRYIAKRSGEPTTPQAELKTQAWYFVFQVIQVFLVTTFSSGLAAVAAKISQDPRSAPDLLAQNLPKASNFYLTYFILQGTASAAKNVLNYSDLAEYVLCDRFLDKTPRAKYERYVRFKNISWGTVYPKFANFAVIALAYSCITPLVLGFAAAGLTLFYLSYRYNMLYVYQTKIDTKGEAYSRALGQLMTGLYLSTLCLIGLFGARKAAGPSTLMVIFLVVTAVTHTILDQALRPLELYLAVDRDGEEALLLAEEGENEAEDQEGEQATTQRAASSHVNRLKGLRYLPPSLSMPLAHLVESQVSAARRQARAWLHDPSSEEVRENHTTSNEERGPDQDEEKFQTAYLHPALTSSLPKLWIPHDEAGVSAREIAENEKVGIPTTDEGAWLDSENKVRWAMDEMEEKVPIFKKQS